MKHSRRPAARKQQFVSSGIFLLTSKKAPRVQTSPLSVSHIGCELQFTSLKRVAGWETSCFTGPGASGGLRCSARSFGHILIIPVSSTGRSNTIQTVDPTILPLVNRSVRVDSITPKKGGVAFESMLANDFGF